MSSSKGNRQAQARPAKELIVGVDYGDDAQGAAAKGEVGDARLVRRIIDTVAAAGATAVCWRVTNIGFVTYPSRVHSTWFPRTPLSRTTIYDLIFARCDPLREAMEHCRKAGLAFYAYVTLFDDAYGGMETLLGHRHPEYYLRDHAGADAQGDLEGRCLKGIFSYGYPEVRAWRMELIRELVSYGPDGVYLDCARTHAGANPIPVHGWQPAGSNPFLRYGYNDHEVARYRERYGADPPVRTATDLRPLDPTPDEVSWNRVRGSFVTDFIREASATIHSAGRRLCVGFYPSTYNGFNPGYHCRQQLGWLDIDWRGWTEEGLVDEIRLIADHRKFGYDDWMACSKDTYAEAQQRGVRVFIDCALDECYDRLENPPASLPVSVEKDGDLVYELQEQMTLKMLRSSADGVFCYEHWRTPARTWKALRRARDRYAGAEEG